ncbi:hypothetical protein BZK31_05110 [Pseudomonas floridensis]|uniref:Uncharacterized protein n=1 Tax=Pseudomonas floridensis TaxID=1958950 RepID=A0A1X0N9W9_9PSED|nr:hypothetical protein [Pseudomonas floridensis]ORC60821.1 hypothetical protein BZK31_05110 [Pseudomonas floridensis]
MFNKNKNSPVNSENLVTEKSYDRHLENGCKANVCARQLPDGDIELVVCVMGEDGHTVAKRTTKLPGAEWTVPDAMKRGIDQAERIAGGESGRLRVADRADREEDDDDDAPDGRPGVARSWPDQE